MCRGLELSGLQARTYPSNETRSVATIPNLLNSHNERLCCNQFFHFIVEVATNRPLVPACVCLVSVSAAGNIRCVSTAAEQVRILLCQQEQMSDLGRLLDRVQQ